MIAPLRWNYQVMKIINRTDEVRQPEGEDVRTDEVELQQGENYLDEHMKQPEDCTSE